VGKRRRSVLERVCSLPHAGLRRGVRLLQEPLWGDSATSMLDMNPSSSRRR
jgi:hypothetical protein